MVLLELAGVWHCRLDLASCILHEIKFREDGNAVNTLVRAQGYKQCDSFSLTDTLHLSSISGEFNLKGNQARLLWGRCAICIQEAWNT